MANILFISARDSLFELLYDDIYLGAKHGTIASLHTWTKTLKLHPHIHCLVTGGGLTSNDTWINTKTNFLLPFDVLKINFRERVKKAILSASLKNKLKLSIVEFIERFLQHIFPQNAGLVKSYGLYANSKKPQLAKCRQFLGQNPVEDVAPVDWQSGFKTHLYHFQRLKYCNY